MNMPIKSWDPRKPLIVAALKAASNCRKITMVRETDTHYEGNAMYPNVGGVCGTVAVKKADVAVQPYVKPGPGSGLV